MIFFRIFQLKLSSGKIFVHFVADSRRINGQRVYNRGRKVIKIRIKLIRLIHNWQERYPSNCSCRVFLKTTWQILEAFAYESHGNDDTRWKSFPRNIHNRNIWTDEDLYHRSSECGRLPLTFGYNASCKRDTRNAWETYSCGSCTLAKDW